MDTEDIIFNLEKRYITQLESFFLREWGETRLWSHDLSHHRRVWNYAKELLNYPKLQIKDPLFSEKLLIGCYLHDLGMAKESGESHGQRSMELCEKFLMENNLNRTNFTDLLEAVEKHDEKEYSKSSRNNRLLQLLSVADDLDAFGYTGIYRYLEIYLVRGTNQLELGQKILDNAWSRFENFEKIFGAESHHVNNHRKRFHILTEFFNGYVKQIPGKAIDNIEYTKRITVVRAISENLKNGRTFHNLLQADRNAVHDPFLHEFLENLESELKSPDFYS
jgi:hypothetical protein